METILQIIEETPWYVFLIFFYVLYMGLTSLKPRTIPFRKVLVLPLVLTLWSISIFRHHWDGQSFSLLLWLGCIAIGVIVGWYILSFYRFQVDREKRTIRLPGSRWTLILVLSLFVVRYFFGYLYSTMAVVPDHFLLIDFAISGFLIGIFIGRAFHYLRIYSRK